jgi:hypothetical protein
MASPPTPTTSTTLAAAATSRLRSSVRRAARGSISRWIWEERIRRRDRFGIQGELAGDGLEGVERLTALRTAGNVLGQQSVGLGGVLARKALERVSGQELLRFSVAVDHRASSNAARSFRIAANVRVLTVPSGMPSSSAICTWVFPSK